MRRALAGRRAAASVVALLLATSAVACVAAGSGRDDGGGFGNLRRDSEPAPWDVRAGVEQITVTGAEPGEPLTLYGSGQHKLITLEADEAGQAHFAYVPGEYAQVASGPDLDYSQLDVPNGSSVAPGRSRVVDRGGERAVADHYL